MLQGREKEGRTMAPGGRLANEYLSWPGLLTVGLGYGCYWLSTRSGKKAAELEKVPRLESLAGELQCLLPSTHFIRLLSRLFSFLWGVG